jgi:para-nitrobenzyl esterase
MATPGAGRLFTRAIIQSAPLGTSRGRQKMTAAMEAAGASIGRDLPIATVLTTQETVMRVGSGFGRPGLMPFGTQYGRAPLPAEEAVDASWGAAGPSIDILIGSTAQEVRLFMPGLPATKRLRAIPVVGEGIVSLLSRLLTRRVYSEPARTFARRHRRAGGTAHLYTVTWSAAGNWFGSAHAIEIPLLLGTREAWEGVELVRGTPWDEMNADGRALRALWASFARGDELPSRGGIAGVISYDRV